MYHYTEYECQYIKKKTCLMNVFFNKNDSYLHQEVGSFYLKIGVMNTKQSLLDQFCTLVEVDCTALSIFLTQHTKFCHKLSDKIGIPHTVSNTVESEKDIFGNIYCFFFHWSFIKNCCFLNLRFLA